MHPQIQNEPFEGILNPESLYFPFTNAALFQRDNNGVKFRSKPNKQIVFVRTFGCINRSERFDFINVDWKEGKLVAYKADGTIRKEVCFYLKGL